MDQIDTAADQALSRRLAAWWGRAHAAVRVLLIILPAVGAIVTAWAVSQTQASTVERLVVLTEHAETRLDAVEVAVGRLTSEGAGRSSALANLRLQTLTLAESVTALREVTARLAGGVDALLRYVATQEPPR